ncbi:hypothetical protein D3C79_640070 [compost metagenome]
MYRNHMPVCFGRREKAGNERQRNGEQWEPVLPPPVGALACLLVCFVFGLAAWV